MIKRAALTADSFPKINGKKIGDPIIGWSAKGGVTRDNIADMAIKMIV